jgi:hypothetical protein
MVSQKDRHLISVYLDGKEIKTLSLSDAQLVQWNRCVFSLSAADTTDWTRMQIDEVVFGADQNLPEARQPENAPYRFSPDTVDIHQDFETQPIPTDWNMDNKLVSESNGALLFNFPAGKDEQSISLEMPGKPINVDNYYATRFRFTSPDDNAWGDWAGFFIGVTNKDFQGPGRVDLSIGSARRELNFEGHYGPNGVINAFAYNQNDQSGIWHTLEMLIKPPADSSQTYAIYYWVDGYLLGKGDLQNPAPFLDKNAPLVVSIQINSGAYRQNVFSGEIDELVIGTLARDKIQE